MTKLFCLYCEPIGPGKHEAHCPNYKDDVDRILDDYEQFLFEAQKLAGFEGDEDEWKERFRPVKEGVKRRATDK